MLYSCRKVYRITNILSCRSKRYNSQADDLCLYKIICYVLQALLLLLSFGISVFYKQSHIYALSLVIMTCFYCKRLNMEICSIFVYNFSGAHTNNIEVQWRHCKEFVRKRCRNKTCDRVTLQSMLYIYMWHKWLGFPYPGGAPLRLLADNKAAYPLC